MAFIRGFPSRGISSGQLSGSRSLYITNLVKLKKPRNMLSCTFHPFLWDMASFTRSKYSCTPSLLRSISKSGISIPCSVSFDCREMLGIISSPVQRSLKEPFTLRLSSSTGMSISGASLYSGVPLSSSHLRKPMAR